MQTLPFRLISRFLTHGNPAKGRAQLFFPCVFIPAPLFRSSSQLIRSTQVCKWPASQRQAGTTDCLPGCNAASPACDDTLGRVCHQLYGGFYRLRLFPLPPLNHRPTVALRRWHLLISRRACKPIVANVSAAHFLKGVWQL